MSFSGGGLLISDTLSVISLFRPFISYWSYVLFIYNLPFIYHFYIICIFLWLLVSCKLKFIQINLFKTSFDDFKISIATRIMSLFSF